ERNRVQQRGAAGAGAGVGDSRADEAGRGAGPGRAERQRGAACDGSGAGAGRPEVRDRMTFASPWFLLAALAIPALVAVAVAIDRRRARYPVAFTNLHVLAEVVPARKSRWKRFIPVALLALA